MVSIVRVKVGKYTYLYESESYRNKNGESRNHRKIIGKIDPVTGRYIFKQDYLDRMASAGNPVETQPTESSFSEEDIRLSTVRN